MRDHRTDSAPEPLIALPERYRDPWLLVVDKPSGLPSQPAQEGGRRHVYGILAGRERYVGLHHRLDTPASGLLVLTLDPAANAGLARDLRERRVRRLYLGLVLGDPGAEGCWNAPIDGQPAQTRWRRLGSQGGTSVLLLSLETGRTHQIRVHLSHLRWPIVGDPLYGGNLRLPVGASEALKSALREFRRQALHAETLAFAHPRSGEEVRATAPVPQDFIDLLDVLRHSAEGAG